MSLTPEEIQRKAELARQVEADAVSDAERHAEVQAIADARQQAAFAESVTP